VHRGLLGKNILRPSGFVTGGLAATLVVALLAASPASTAMLSFTPVADSYVDESNKGKNFGTTTALNLDNSPVLRAYLRFNVQNVSGTVTQASLRLYSRSSSSVGFSARSVADNSWGEKTISYRNAPGFSGTISGSSGSFASGRWVSIDVTPLVRGNGLVSFALTTTTATAMALASREYGASFAPQLVVTWSGAPANSSPPTISGTPQDGRTLTANPGSWTGTAPISYAYRWRRCDAGGANCADIPGATASTYALGADDVGKTIRVAVTASNAEGSGTATSASTPSISAMPPSDSSPPTISGTPQDGRTLTADPGTWTGTAPISYAYRWRRCDAGGANCADIPGATASTYALGADDVGKTIRVAVTASNAGGSGTATSANTTAVAAAPPTNTSSATITGFPEDTRTLTADPGAWTGTAPITYAYQWRACDSEGANCTDIPGATDATYTLTAADVGARIRVAVRASNATGSETSSSNASGTVSAIESVFGFSYWPHGKNSSTTLGADPEYWPSMRPVVERDLDQIVSMGGGHVRLVLSPSADPVRVWKLAGPDQGVNETLLQEQATNLVQLLGLCRDRGLKVTIAFANTYIRRMDADQYWWEWGYGPQTEDPSDTDGWDRFLADALRWVDGYVTKVEQSPVEASAVIGYEYQNEVTARNPWSWPYVRHLYDNVAVPPGKRAESVLVVSEDVSPADAPFVSGLGGRHLDYVNFHSYPGSDIPLNPNIESSYDDMVAKLSDSTIFLGEFGRSTPKNDDGTIDQAAEDAQRATVVDIINRAKLKRIPYYLHWMLWDDSPPSSKPIGLGYEPHQPKDALGSALPLTSRLRNSDMEEGSGSLAAWTATGTSTVPGNDLGVTLDQHGSAGDRGATNVHYAHLGVENPPGHARLGSSPVYVTGGGLFAVDAYVRSNMSDVGLRVTQTLTSGDEIVTSGPTFTPSGPTWNNWLHGAGDWRLCLNPTARKVEVTVHADADIPSPTDPYYLDVDTVSAAVLPGAPACP
jgi:hypothetical protein